MQRPPDERPAPGLRPPDARDASALIHPSAVIDERASLAADVEVGAYSVIGADVSLASGCRIGPHVVLNGPLAMGRDNRVFQFASLGDAPQDLKYDGEATRLEIGDRNVFREYATANRGTVGGGGVTRIGDDNLFMAYTHVAHDCQVGNSIIFSNAASLAGHVVVGDRAILGGFTTVHQFSHLGEYCFTGLSSMVNRDVPPYVKVSGNPIKAFGINSNGLRRRDFADDTIRALQKAYRALVYSRGQRAAAVDSLEPLRARHPEVERFVQFVLASERGIVR